jgi:hypothetical protein
MSASTIVNSSIIAQLMGWSKNYAQKKYVLSKKRRDLPTLLWLTVWSLERFNFLLILLSKLKKRHLRTSIILSLQYCFVV